MAKDTKTTKTPEAKPAVDRTKLYVCIYKDEKGTPLAFGADCDKSTAKKLAAKASAKYEKKNSANLDNFEIRVVSLADAK